MGSQSNWRRNPLVLCPLGGWLAGMLWWAGLMVAFGPSTGVSFEGGFRVERRQSVASHVTYAPVVALPWAAVWALVGAANVQFRGYWVPVAAGLGAAGGGVFVLAVNPFDGWLTMIMPIGCLGGTLVGLVLGMVTRGTWGWLNGWEDSQ